MLPRGVVHPTPAARKKGSSTIAKSPVEEFSVERTPDGEALTNFVLAVFATNGRLLRAGDRMMRDLGITSARWQVLGAIAERPKTVAQIAREYELTRQGVLWVVQAMIKDGMVELISNPDHLRAKLVQTTKKGRAVYEEIDRRQHIWVNGLAASFKSKELTIAMATIQRLGDRVKDHNPFPE
jgi:DNA-binding MarR family transcriptional regulator